MDLGMHIFLGVGIPNKESELQYKIEILRRGKNEVISAAESQF